MLLESRSNLLHVAAGYQPVFREIGLDAEAIYVDARIKCWRKLGDRENCTLDERLSDGRGIRFHIKRYPKGRHAISPAKREVEGYRLLEDAQIPAATLVGWGELADGRSFIISDDLKGYEAADKLIAGGFAFDRLRDSLADLSAKLHGAGLHHRDLYLCHFFVKADSAKVDVKLIDVARVKKLPGFSLLRRRWIVKDLAQFWYSTLPLGMSDEQRDVWLKRYLGAGGAGEFERFKRLIERKVKVIGRHDAKLRVAQPGRNISLPE